MAAGGLKIAEVIETKLAYRTLQQDEDGNELYDGSIQIRLNAQGNFLGQVKTEWAAPARPNMRIPLVGEQIMVFVAPSIRDSSPDEKGGQYFYLSPYNSANTITTHEFHQNWERSVHNTGDKPMVETLNDIKEIGYTINKDLLHTAPLQPFEGDDIWQGRLGQTIRFTRHFESVNKEGIQIYERQPNWKGKKLNDPMMIFNLKQVLQNQHNLYAIEDLSDDAASIYMTTTQMLPKLTMGSKKDSDVAAAPKYDKSPQLVINSGRVVMNATKDDIMMVGKNQAIVSARKVRFVSDKYSVDLDDLMSWLKIFSDFVTSTHRGLSPFAAAMGPTGPASNAGKASEHNGNFNKKFK